MELLSRILRAARVRIFWQLFLTFFGLLVAAACCGLLLTGLLQFFFDRPPFQPEFLWWALGAVLVGTFFLLWRAYPDLGRTARILDRRGQTKDRYYTALCFGESPERQRMEEAALTECQQFVEKHDWRALTPIRVPRSFLVAFAPLVAMALLQVQFFLNQEPPAEAPTLQGVVDKQAKELDKLTQQLGENQRLQQSAELEKLVKELRNTSQRISEKRPTNEEIRRAALREFSSLQAMLEEMMKAANLETSPEELKALAEALKQMNQEEAAKDIEDGKFEEASKKLEELAKQLQGANPEKTRQQLADSMKEALDRLTDDQKKEVASQMQQLAEAAKAMQDPAIQKQLQKLQELMQQLAKSQKGKQQQQQQQNQGDPQKGDGQQQQQMPLTAEALQQMIEALERMKQQLQDGQQPDSDQNGPMISMDLPGMNGQPGTGMMEANGPPSGNPGSEMDFGTTESPYGATQTEKPKSEGPAKRISGVLGEGETLREFIGAAGDESKARQRYKEIYQASAAQAQDTVSQETIPLGSRLLIRRYFESIRPKE